MASFYIPLTGLETDSTAMNTIANNLANMNTTGFKSQTVNFSDLFYQQIGTEGSGDEIQLGAGVQTSSIESDFTQGGVDSTGVSSDVYLDGNGFFVLNDGGTNIYTRDGNFGTDQNGNLITASGLPVMGFPAVGGVVNTSAPLAPISIPVGQVEPPQPTSTFGMTVNLDSSAAVGAVVPGQVKIYDSLGANYMANVTYTKTGTNTWSYAITLPAGSSTGSANTTGTLAFDANGNLTTPTANVPGINFTGMSDGAADMSMTWNISGTAGKPTITQVDSASGVSATTQNGYTSGQYQSFTVGADGTVSATFSNGQPLAVGQLALANVSNLQGLQLMGSGNYATTLASGEASVGVSGAAGLGSIQDGVLEDSNVNISAEFSDLIIAQRAFEANSKAVTTFDTVTQETINMIH
ncbi:flagellar hook protein FlgE [Acidicapsa ligni]|uniref:flagellar hook protein FlgE n=1 Tax=Acidicapsa ligni TaxID=542300 RepID=UPI0021E0A476|nr:flagellar hook protein FlgE [Acidicapsa ligni]